MSHLILKEYNEDANSSWERKNQVKASMRPERKIKDKSGKRGTKDKTWKGKGVKTKVG